MQHLRSIDEMREWRANAALGADVALIPTMGALHQGHAALIKAAEGSGLRVVSIFVNPIQFDRQADLDAYPQTLEEDLTLCESLGVDAVFTTSKEEMYPNDFATSVEVGGLDTTLCGATRPGHFAGVTTVVSKLFNMVQPTKAYFGEKDFQQLAIIRRMVADLNTPVEIVGVPTQRAEDGLALSSRNVNLNAKQRQQAPVIYSALIEAYEAFQSGQRDSGALVAAARASIETEVEGSRIDYLELVDFETLQPAKEASERSLLATAVYLGDTRLIDNIRFG